MIRKIVLALLLAVPLFSSAQSTANQGQGQSAGSKPWRVDHGAQNAGKTTEVLVVSTAGATLVPAVPLANRKVIEIQNNGPDAIYCTVDGSTPVSATNGRWIAGSSGAGKPGGAWVLDAGPNIGVKCIADTADQLTGAATMVTELQ